MAYFSDLFNAGNVAGQICADANAAGLSFINSRPHPDGELVDIQVSGVTRATDVVLHRNGRVGTRDATKDTLVFTIAQLAAMGAAAQEVIHQYGQAPAGENVLFPGRLAGSTVIVRVG